MPARGTVTVTAARWGAGPGAGLGRFNLKLSIQPVGLTGSRSGLRACLGGRGAAAADAAPGLPLAAVTVPVGSGPAGYDHWPAAPGPAFQVTVHRETDTRNSVDINGYN